MKFICPECGADGEFVEVVIMTMEVKGHFDDVGVIVEEYTDCIDSMTDRYVCLTCEEEFDKPKKIEDEQEKTTT